MKIFITGVAGFLGGHLAKRMLDLGHEVSGNDNFIGGELSNVPKEVKFASCSADKSRKLLNYKTKTNLKEAIKKTSDFIKKNGVRKFKYYLPIEIINDKTPETWVKKLI